MTEMTTELLEFSPPLVWFDIVDDDVPSIKRHVMHVPRKGEHVGVIPVFPDETPLTNFKLHIVVDVRHYWDAEGDQEIHVLLSENP
jgi:hypothetical protein